MELRSSRVLAVPLEDLLRHDVGASLDDARRLLGEAMTSAEYREGIAAFRERRPPRF